MSKKITELRTINALEDADLITGVDVSEPAGSDTRNIQITKANALDGLATVASVSAVAADLAAHESTTGGAAHTGMLIQDDMTAHKAGANQHSIAGVTGLQTALDAKEDTANLGGAAYLDVGATSGDVAAGDAPVAAVTAHETAYKHANIPTDAQKGAMDAAAAPGPANAFATIDDVPTEHSELGGRDSADQHTGDSFKVTNGVPVTGNAVVMDADGHLVAGSSPPGGGTGTDELVAIDDQDLVGGFLADKLVAEDASITLTKVGGDGTNKTLQIRSNASGGGIEDPPDANNYLRTNGSWVAAGDSATKDTGSLAGQVAAGNHNHAGVYAPVANGVTGGDAHNHDGGDGAQIAYGTLSGLPTLGTAAAADTGDFAPSGEGVTNGNLHDHSGGDGGQIAYGSLSGTPLIGSAAYEDTSAFAAASEGVTNGDTHNHSGGDGAQIAYASLSGLPTLGDSAALDVGATPGTVAAGDDSRFTDSRDPTAHAATHAAGQVDEITPADIGAAPSSQGVSGGNGHDHNGGDGAQISYNNLSDQPALGNSAALNVGTSAGTVAAGDDSRFDDIGALPARADLTPSGSVALTVDERAYTMQLVNGNSVGWNITANGDEATVEHTCSIDFLPPTTGSATVNIPAGWRQMGEYGAITLGDTDELVSVILRTMKDATIQIYRSQENTA